MYITTEEIISMSDDEIRHLERTLAKRFMKRLAVQLAFRTALAIGTHQLMKRIYRKIEEDNKY